MELLKGLYHADKLDEQSFIDNFTIRLKEYRLIHDNLMQQKQKPLQHFLITGKRGMGKSTLLRRIYIDATTPPLSEKLFAVRLGSEQYRLSRLFKLWEQVIEHLSNKEPKLRQKKIVLYSSRDYENNLIHIITDYLAETKKTLLLLIDNFDQLIEKMQLKEQHALREILIQYPIQIIGNTLFYNEHFKSYNKPFFDFFKPVHLANLEKEEAEDFIKLRAAAEGIEDFDEVFKKQYGKIQALRILSGGVPRTLLILLSIIAKKNTGDAVEYLHEMIEQTTPLYQDRMKSLSSQQQEIMHHLAMQWNRTGAKELAAEMRVPSKTVSAQLVSLEAIGYINKVETTGRNYYYEIDERFFNIWLLMSEAPPYSSKRVIWLTKWLDAFYSNDELKDFASFCHQSLKTAKPANRLLLAQALSESEKLGYGLKKQIVSETTEDLKDSIAGIKLWESTFNHKLDEHANLLKKEIESLIAVHDYEKALRKLDALEEIDEVRAYTLKGFVFSLMHNFEMAKKYYLMAVENGNDVAMLSLGFMYYTMKHISLAEKYYLMAAQIGNDPAMFMLGSLYQTEKRNILAAEKYYLMAAEKGNIESMYCLGILYHYEKDDIAAAEKYYLMAVEKGNVDAMLYLGILYQYDKDDIAAAEKCYNKAAKKGNSNAMAALGYIYETEKKDIAAGEKYYHMAAEHNNAIALYLLGSLYFNEKNDAVKSAEYYQRAIEYGHTDSMLELSLLYFKTNNNSQKGKALELLSTFVMNEQEIEIETYIILAALQLWNEKFKDAGKTISEVLNKPHHTNDELKDISDGLLYFLVFRQKHLLLTIFKSNQEYIDRFKPVYFTLMLEMQDEYPKEYLKMTEELEEPVKTMLAFVKKEQNRLGL